ncbi:MAG TPA: hypothetical protein VHZ55_27825 [Bryobacteraceae bacterium]|nr:hypothetical protein [Bryobacteraceae bacterium]
MSVKAAISLYALGSIASGVVNIVWGNFEPAHQPIQAFGDHIPGQRVFAFFVAVCLIAAGAALLWRRTIRAGAVILGVVYSLFAVFWLPRFYTAVHALGFRVPVIVGLLVGVGQELILVAAAVLVYLALNKRDGVIAPLFARWTFGLSSIDFGLAHFTAVQFVSAMVPKWIPFGGEFWATLTGVAFVLAGVAIVSGVLDVLAARLLAVMLTVFSIFTSAPRAITSLHDHVAVGSNAYNLAAIGAAWMLAEWIVVRRACRHHELKANAS